MVLNVAETEVLLDTSHKMQSANNKNIAKVLIMKDLLFFFFVPVMIEETLKAVMENTGGEDHGTNSSGCVKM